jgi:hypothetical protein
MVAGFMEEQLYRWLRAAELTCDRAALLVVQDPKVLTPSNYYSKFMLILADCNFQQKSWHAISSMFTFALEWDCLHRSARDLNNSRQ